MAGDSAQTISNMSRALAGLHLAHVITSDGKPQITSEPKAHLESGSVSDPYMKAAVDFFMLSDIERWFSNCDFLACGSTSPARLWNVEPHQNQVILDDEARLGQVNLTKRGCSNTFAGSIWVRRFAVDARSPLL